LKVGQLMVREYIDMTQPVTAVVLDQSGWDESVGQFDEACDIAASIVMSCAAREIPVAFVSVDTAAELVSGSAAMAGVDRVLDLMAGLQRHERRLPLAGALPVALGVGIVFLVTSEAANAEVDRAGLIARGCRVVHVRVRTDPTEEARSAVGVMKVATLEQFMSVCRAVA
jgi:hypothetical protein